MKRFLVVAILLASTAWADVAPPNISGCRGKKAGATCTTDADRPGLCQKSTCARNDYSNGPPPKVVDYECLLCEATNSSHTTDTTVHTTPATPPPATPAKDTEPATPSAATPSAATPSAATPSTEKSPDCTAAPGGPLALLVLAAGGLLLRRRRSA